MGNYILNQLRITIGGSSMGQEFANKDEVNLTDKEKELVYETIKEAADYIRNGNGPVLVEAETYRYFGHSKSDRNLYRNKDEIADWRKRDPIVRFKTTLIDGDILTNSQAAEIDRKAQEEIDAAVTFAENSPDPDPSSVEEYVSPGTDSSP